MKPALIDNEAPMKTLYYPEIEKFLNSQVFRKSEYMVRENRIFRLEKKENQFQAQVLGQEPLPQKVHIIFHDAGFHCQCECGRIPCQHLGGLLHKLYSLETLPSKQICNKIQELLQPETPELPSQIEGDLFSDLDLFSEQPIREQHYDLEFQLFRNREEHLYIRPANRHILEDGSSGQISRYQPEKLKAAPGLKNKALIDLILPGTEKLSSLLDHFLDKERPLVMGQMGHPLSLEPMEKLHIRFKLHSFIPGRGILFTAFLRPVSKGLASEKEYGLKDFEAPRDGIMLLDEEQFKLIYMKDCPQEQTFLSMIHSKEKGMPEQELQGMSRLRERLKAHRIELDYSLVDTRIREYPPRLIIQLQNRYDKLRLIFLFSYEDSRISAQDLRDYFPAAEEGCGVMYKRDRHKEQELIHGATAILEDEIVYQRGLYASLVDAAAGEDLRLKLELQDFISYYGEEMINQGITLELEQHPLRYQGTLSFQMKKQEDWLELQAHQEGSEIFLDDLFESHGLVNIQGNYLILKQGDIDMINRLKRQGLDHQGKLETSAANLPLLETMEDHLNDEDPLKERLLDLKELNHLEQNDTDPPRLENFGAQLRNYQEQGLKWLRFLHQRGLHGCLADDMGLGKTVQTLSLIHHLKNLGEWKTSLLIGPVVTLANWEAEIAKFSPEIRFHRHQGAFRAQESHELSGYDLIISSYQTIRNDVELFSSIDFFYIILDEAHYIKNASSQTFHAVKALKSHHRLSLTGTPIENNTLELWSQISFLNPGLLGTMREFQYRFAYPIEREGCEDSAALLRETVYPFILRRTKEEVATDLPPREEIILNLEMSGEQQEVYQRMKDFYHAQVKGLLNSQGRQKSSIQIFSYLLKLRQLAIHPPMAGEDYDQVSSCKMDALTDLLDEICSEDHKVLVFSTFLATLENIRKICENRHWGYSLLTGKTEDREEQINRFQQDPDTRIFLLSLKAGGVGINLTAADYVVLFDPWWNPAVERQAVDRAYRIGQKRKVFTYRMITKGTIEEKIRKMQESKQDLADRIITEDEGFSKNLSDDDILKLFE